MALIKLAVTLWFAQTLFGMAHGTWEHRLPGPQYTFPTWQRYVCITLVWGVFLAVIFLLVIPMWRQP